jgi:hypothetical protein
LNFLILYKEIKDTMTKDQTLLNELKEWLEGGIKYFESLNSEYAVERKLAYQNVIMKINDLQRR